MVVNFFEELNRTQLAERVHGLLIIPVGACEQHGPHLATGTDAMIVRKIAELSAQKIESKHPVTIAPTLPFGFSHHHLPFGATITISPDTYQKFLLDMCDSLVTSGFKKLFILNGHGGNNEMIGIVAREFALKYKIRMGAGSYWTMAWNELTAVGAHEHNRLPGHAGAFETSIMQYLNSDLVAKTLPIRSEVFSADPRSFYPGYMVEDQENWLRIDGFSDNPSLNSEKNGEIWLNAAVSGVTNSLNIFISDFKD